MVNITTNESIIPVLPLWEIVGTVIPLSLIIIFIFLGNLLVVVAILCQKSLRTPSNIYILSLALTDLFVGFFILPFNVIEMMHNKWEFGMTFCRIWLTSDVTLCSSSILHISAIAVDRFRSINEGLSYAQSRTKRMSVIICFALWFLALWIASPPVLGWNDWEGRPSTECFLTRKVGYIIHSATGAFFIPSFIMAGLYIRIFFLLKKKFRERAEIKCVEHSQDLDHSSADTGNNSTGDIIDAAESEADGISKSGTVRIVVANGHGTLKSSSSGSKTTKHKRKHSEQITAILKKKTKFSLTKERKAARTLGILIGAFLICWTPFTMTYLASGILPQGSVNPKWFQFVTWLGYVNSGVNPVIYTIYSEEFRRAFQRVLCIRRY